MGVAMAQQYTRKMIRDMLVQMLEEMSLDKITVKDLVTRCQINRNTFYYYYPDLYAIVTEIFTAEMERVIDEYNDTRSWEESFLLAARFALEHKRAVYHVYNSIRKEELERYLLSVAGNVMTRYVQTVSRGIHASDIDKAIIAAFYQGALTELLMHWISGGMKQDPEKLVRRIGQLFDGNIELSLRRSAALPIERWNAEP